MSRTHVGKRKKRDFGFGEREKPAKVFFLEKESFEPTDREMFSRLFLKTKAFLGSVSKSVLKILQTCSAHHNF